MRILPNDHERSWDSETISAGTTCFLSWDLFLRNQEVMIVLRRSYPGTIIARMRILSETRHAEGNHPRKNWSRKILQVNGESIAGFSPGNFLLRTPLTIPRHPAKRLLLFYRYMLPHVTSEVYSWADPVEAFFGFKTGVENCFFCLSMMVCSRSFFTSFISNGSYFRPVCRFILWGLFDRYLLGINRYWRVDTQKTLVQ